MWAEAQLQPLGPALSIRPGSLVRAPPSLPPKPESASVGKTLGGRVAHFPGGQQSPGSVQGKGSRGQGPGPPQVTLSAVGESLGNAQVGAWDRQVVSQRPQTGH